MKVPTATRTAEASAPIIEMSESDDRNLPAQILPGNVTYQTGAPQIPAIITAAIAEVMTEVGVITKEGYNEFHKYPYARIEDILQKLTPLLGKRGLVIYQSEIGREMFDDGRVLGVNYRFTVAHKSGAQAPPQDQSGMSRCRDSKSGFDDKSLAKAHTQARKYFLLALFQIASDVDSDAEGGPPGARRVPPAARRSETKETPKRSDAPPDPRDSPYYVHANDLISWCTGFMAKVEQAKDHADVDAIQTINLQGLQRVAKEDPDAYKRLGSAVGEKRKRLTSLGLYPVKEQEPPLKPDPAIPDAAKAPDEFLKWVDVQLAKIDENMRDSLQDIIDNVIEPRTAGLMPPDIEELHAIYDRHARRLEP